MRTICSIGGIKYSKASFKGSFFVYIKWERQIASGYLHMRNGDGWGGFWENDCKNLMEFILMENSSKERFGRGKNTYNSKECLFKKKLSKGNSEGKFM